MPLKQTILEFNTPSAPYRGKPFWAWNARLEADLARRQVDVFKRMGFGGFFMHSRVGLETPYLGDQWFDVVGHCIDQAQQNGMEAWLYDEDRWPSGPAGGLVTQDIRYAMRTLALERIENPAAYHPSESAEVVWLFAAKFTQKTISEYRQISQPAEVPDGWELLVFRQELTPCSSWFNGQRYLDTLDADAVGRFIAVTHQAYADRWAEKMGPAKTIPGIFTDEPNRGANFRKFWGVSGQLAWTPKLPDYFKTHYNYNLLDHLPELAFDLTGQEYSRARYHYYCTLSRLFAENFFAQIGAWCDKHNIMLTGHVLEEHPLSHAVSVVGSAMQCYTYMQAPGIDILTQYKLEYLTAKQCVSVARQMGRKWVLSELYGCTGWDITFEAYKHSGDWQAALGITLRCPHLSLYSMAGEAKRDYPASIHFHSPWWKQYRYVEDYFSRLNVMLTEGKPICDLALIHPIESVYLQFKHSMLDNDDARHKHVQDPACRKIDQQLDDLIVTLQGGHVDFDFADEHLLVELNAQTGTDACGPYLQIGKMTYRAVLVPSLQTIRGTTLQLLKQFADLGGSVTFVGSAPAYVDVLPDDAATQLAAGRTVDQNPQTILAAVAPAAQRVHITDPTGTECTDVFCQLRRTDYGYVLFMVNTNRQDAHPWLDVKLELDNDMGHGQCVRFDAFTGRRYAMDAALTGRKAHLTVDLEPSGSVLIGIIDHIEELDVFHNGTAETSVCTLDPPQWGLQPGRLRRSCAGPGPTVAAAPKDARTFIVTTRKSWTWTASFVPGWVWNGAAV